MSIGVVTTSYPRWSGDHAGNFVDEHVRAMRAAGHAVEVIAAGDATTDASPDADGVTRIASALFYRGGAPDLLARDSTAMFAAAAFTARMIKRVATRAPRWDLIVAHWLAPSAIAALPCRAPLLAIAHGGDVHALRRARLLATTLYALRARGARLAFVSAQLLELARDAAPGLSRWLDDAAIVQAMGIDVARFAAIAADRKRVLDAPPTVLIAARLVDLKGIDVAIDALARVRTPARLVIAGAGPEHAALTARARASSASARIAFAGAVDTPARDELLRTAELVIIPSRVVAGGRSEGTPLIALEALAAGLPVIASAVGGLRALAPAAELVPPDDPAALAAAIDRVLATPLSPRLSVNLLADLDWARVSERLASHARV
jgi:glycosyltransferase involved in cell wall biosynthesis